MAIKYSVAIATFNGEKYIAKQVQSILDQTLPVDEIIISDDGSSDNTIEILKSLDYGNTVIKYYSNEGRHGPSGNVENSIKLCTGDYIFLADQDDIWYPNKVEVFNQFISSHPSVKCIASNGCVIGSNDEVLDLTFFERTSSQYTKVNRNDTLLLCIDYCLVRGMALCISREFLTDILPFPDCYGRHDMWIEFCAVCIDSFFLIDEILVKYRLHDKNAVGDNRVKKKKVSKITRKIDAAKNWYYYKNNYEYVLREAMIAKMREHEQINTRAYLHAQKIVDLYQAEYEALHSSGINGAIKLIQVYLSNSVYRKRSKKTIFLYKLLRVLFQSNS